MKEDIILVGGGGHCRAVIEVIESTQLYNILGIIDKVEVKGDKVLDYSIIGCDEEIKEIVKKCKNFAITTGQIKTAALRIKLFEIVKKAGGILPVIKASTSYVSKYASIAEGSIIMHQTFINSNAKIGKNCIINTGALVEHDVHIGDNCHISTGVVLNGEAKIGNNVFIGSNSVVSNQIRVGNFAVIGSGAVVVKNIEANVLAVGNPAIIKK